MEDLFDSRPRGIRNNNPLNIKHVSKNRWKGLVGVDGQGFCIFLENKFCYRAARKILVSYLKRNPSLTLQDFIYQWSPDNNKKNYVSFVSRDCNFLPWVNLEVFNDIAIAMLFNAMSEFECGYKVDNFDYVLNSISKI